MAHSDEPAGPKPDMTQDLLQRIYDDAQARYRDMPPAARRNIDELGNLLATHAGYGEND